ncbi:MAG: YerC/YecD family TrpR-related protein [Candidatus Moranbacteria bacterium]|nr:YerC/YecD family TrpR-related protein [Candidatus Moranbacteria bacterium]
MANQDSKLSKNEVDKILYQLCLAIAELKDPNEAAELLRDLLSYKESEMIAKRLKIAELLINGQIYQDIQETLKVSATTIARVHEWLQISGDGYQKAITRTKGAIAKQSTNKSIDFENWSTLKKKFPAYYWPDILLENIVANANKKQRAQMTAVINKLNKAKEKPAIYKKLRRLIATNNNVLK